MNEDALMKLHRTLFRTCIEAGMLTKQNLANGFNKPATKVYIQNDPATHDHPNVNVAFGNDLEVCLSIDTGQVLAGNMAGELLINTREWVIEHQIELLDIWFQIKNENRPKLLWVYDE